MSDTFHALATPPGTAALAVIRVCGPGVPVLVREIFGTLPSPTTARMARLGVYRDLAGKHVDQVLHTWFPPTSSFTGRDTLEISGHGNPFLVEQILSDLQARGSRPAEPGEFTRTAYLEGRIDLSQAEAVADLIAARSEAAVHAAHRQLAGGLGTEIEARVAEILDVLARLEAHIDFPEEDLPPEDQEGPPADLKDIVTRLNAMIATGRQRELLHRGIRTVILGEVNAGKSSLLNRLLGEERVIVSDTAGTTRDTVGEVFSLGPYCIHIYDTAGFRETPDAIEREGLRHTERAWTTADFHLLVLDGNRPSPTLPTPLLERLHPDNTLIVANKADLPSFHPPEKFLHGFPQVKVSAKTGTGFAGLLRIWERLLKDGLLDGGESRVLYNQRHIGFLRQCRTSLDRAREVLGNGTSVECAIPDIRDALESLGAIVGTVDNEAMLDVLFREFCIGK